MLIKTLHLIASLILFFVFWILFRYHSFSFQPGSGFRYNYYVLILYGVLLIFFNRTYNSFLLGYMRNGLLVFNQFLAQLFSLVIVYGTVSVAWKQLNNPVIFLPLLAVYVGMDILWSYCADRLFLTLNPVKTESGSDRFRGSQSNGCTISAGRYSILVMTSKKSGTEYGGMTRCLWPESIPAAGTGSPSTVRKTIFLGSSFLM